METLPEFVERKSDEMHPNADHDFSARTYFESMLRRRSIREFSTTPVDPKIIQEAIRVAASAPSGGNTQPWYFAVLKTPELRKLIRTQAEIIEESFYSHRAPKEMLHTLSRIGTDAQKPFLEEAPVMIGVFYRNRDTQAGKENICYYAKESTGLATGILLSGLHLSGLATLTYTPNPMGFLNEHLGLDKRLKPFMLVIAGYPKKTVRLPVLPKKPFDEICRTY